MRKILFFGVAALCGVALTDPVAAQFEVSKTKKPVYTAKPAPKSRVKPQARPQAKPQARPQTKPSAGNQKSDIGKVTDQPSPGISFQERPKWINAPLMESTTVDQFIQKLPNWNAQNPPATPQSSVQSQTQKEKEGGRNYDVTRTRYTITETPEEIVTFQPVNGFWLGAIVQEKGLQLGLGSMQEVAVPATKRAAFKVASDLPMGNNFRDISSPSASTVQSATGSLMQAGNNVSWGGARTLSIVENYGEEKAAHDLGLSGHYLTASLKAGLKSDSRLSHRTITVAFIERAFTVQADFEGRSRREAFFKDAFSIADAKNLVMTNRVGMSNLPAYIKSITYGRVVLFTMTSTLSENEMKTAIAASANAIAWGVDVNYNGSQKSKSTQFDLRVTAFGGPQNITNQLVPANGIKSALQVMNGYLKSTAPLSSMVPISYTANSLRDDQLAALSRTTDFTVTKAVPNPIGERFKLKIWLDVTGSDDGVADDVMECYGTLRINGDAWWSVSRDESSFFKREKGQDIEISADAAHNGGRKFEFDAFYDQPKSIGIKLRVRDSDSGSDDDTFGNYDFNLNLLQKGPGEYTWSWNSGDGEASKLRIRIDRLEYL